MSRWAPASDRDGRHDFTSRDLIGCYLLSLGAGYPESEYALIVKSDCKVEGHSFTECLWR